jgi:hypothetical protein
VQRKVDKWDSIKLKSTAKEKVTRLNRQHFERAKIFVGCTSDKILKTRYRELKKVTLQKNQQPIV